jgi:serine/threonine-protein kinase RsbW
VRLDLAVCLPREAETVGLVRAVASDALDRLGVTPACIDDVRLALSEAATNVIHHAADEDEYEVRLEVDGLRCTIIVTNAGGLDTDDLPDAMPEASSARSRGVAIMRAVMDQVDFSSGTETGTEVRLVKSLEPADGGLLARLGLEA